MATIRKSKPESGNPYYNTKGNGGYSTCVKGKPTQRGLDVLCNCVGFASGAFNETIGEGREVYPLNCNAENFIERAISYGLSVVQEPVVGGIMVWQKGTTLGGKDGAGHVAYVSEKIDADNVITCDSGWNSFAFKTIKRNRGNGNWGQSSSYKYRGCIVNPVVPAEPTPAPEPEPEPKKEQKFEIGAKVIINGNLYENSDAEVATGYASNKKTEITRYAEGTKHPYNTSGDLGWMNEDDIKLNTENPSEVKTYQVKFGDTLSGIAVKFNTTVGELIKLNEDRYPQIKISNGNYIQVGWVLVVG